MFIVTSSPEIYLPILASSSQPQIPPSVPRLTGPTATIGRSVPSAKLSLTIIGVALEVVGAFLTFWPEVAPRLSRASAHVRRVTSNLATRIRQLVRRPKTHVVTGAVTPGGAIAGGVPPFGYASVPEEADVEWKLSFLLEQAVETQRRLDHVERRLRGLPAELRNEIAATRSALEERIAQELQDARERFIGRRLAGLGLIVIGSVLLGVVNLL